MKRLGLFGGSFDPVHLGHLLMARAASEELQLCRLHFIPAARSPFKPDRQPAPDAQRAALIRLALAGETHFELDEQELHRAGTSYTVETLRDYARRFPGAELFYIIGADNVAKLGDWREPAELARLATFIVVPRPGETPPAFPQPFRGRVLTGFPVGVSSSQIRARVKSLLPVTHLVPAAVAEAIETFGLYR
jgi:nicotinate-nucleotide adenylyltransferase